MYRYYVIPILSTNSRYIAFRPPMAPQNFRLLKAHLNSWQTFEIRAKPLKKQPLLPEFCTFFLCSIWQKIFYIFFLRKLLSYSWYPARIKISTNHYHFLDFTMHLVWPSCILRHISATYSKNLNQTTTRKMMHHQKKKII